MSAMKQFRSWWVAAAIVMIPTAAWAEDARIAVAAEAAHAEAARQRSGRASAPYPDI